MRRFLRRLVLFALAASCVQLAFAQGKIGIVLMHGKGALPGGHVRELASALAGKGYLVANLEMPWSKRRDYDAGIASAEKQVDDALDKLRADGANKLFVAGHSQGGAFAFHYGSTHELDGLIAIAPGASSGSQSFREKLGATLDQARKLVAEGKGAEKASLADYEGSKGVYPITTTPAAYLEWFDPDGAMNSSNAVRNFNPKVPVLYIAPKDDYPALQKIKQAMFDALPKNPLTRLVEPDASHGEAPTASIDDIVRWTREVAATEK